MTKNTPNKRKSLANATATPNKISKPTASPKKSPKNAAKNPNTPQKKQLNGKQGTPKGKKKPAKTEEDEELEQNESEESMEQELNGNSDSDVEQADSDDEADSDAEGDSDDDEDASDEEEGSPKGKKPAKTDDKSEERKYSVFVGGLNFNCTDNDLLEYFNRDTILKVVILRNPLTKKSKGSAFINFKDESSLKKALEKNGSSLQGRILKVSLPAQFTPDKAIKKKQELLAKLRAQVGVLEKQIANLSGGNKQSKPFNKKGKGFNKNAGKKAQKA